MFKGAPLPQTLDNENCDNLSRWLCSYKRLPLMLTPTFVALPIVMDMLMIMIVIIISAVGKKDELRPSVGRGKNDYVKNVETEINICNI